jgi:hypothetical protein
MSALKKQLLIKLNFKQLILKSPDKQTLPGPVSRMLLPNIAKKNGSDQFLLEDQSFPIYLFCNDFLMNFSHYIQINPTRTPPIYLQDCYFLGETRSRSTPSGHNRVQLWHGNGKAKIE